VALTILSLAMDVAILIHIGASFVRTRLERRDARAWLAHHAERMDEMRERLGDVEARASALLRPPAPRPRGGPVTAPGRPPAPARPSAPKPHIPGRGVAYLTTGQAGRRLGVDSSTIRRWAAEGRIASTVTPGGHLRVLEAAVREAVDARDLALEAELTVARAVWARQLAGLADARRRTAAGGRP